EWWLLEHTHRAVPHDGLRLTDHLGEMSCALLPDVEHGFTSGNRVTTHGMRLRPIVERRRHACVHRQLELFIAPTEQLLRHLDAVVLDQRLPSLESHCLEEGAGHRTTDDELIDLGQQILDDVDLPG